jgi:hypothetical protein
VKYKAILQYEIPSGGVFTTHVVSASFKDAYDACVRDAKSFHRDNGVSLLKDHANSSIDETTYKVVVGGVVDSTEWYVIIKE